MIIVLTILYPHATAWEFVGWFGCRRVSAWRQSSELELRRKPRPPPGGGAFRPGRQVLHPVAGSPGRRRGSYGATDFAGGSDHWTGTAGARQDPFRREAPALARTRKRGHLAQMAAAPPGVVARKAGASTGGTAAATKPNSVSAERGPGVAAGTQAGECADRKDAWSLGIGCLRPGSRQSLGEFGTRAKPPGRQACEGLDRLLDVRGVSRGTQHGSHSHAP